VSTPESQIPDFNSFAATRAPDFNSFAASHRAAPSAPHDARPVRAQLPPVDPRLDSFVSDVMNDASKRSGYTYRLGEGSRTPEQQAGKVAAGYSRTYHSKHLTGHGRDVLAFDASGNYITDGAHDAYKTLGDVYREKAAAAGLPIRWGGDFHDFYDPGHFEIEDDGDAAPAAAPADVPDFNSFAASRDVPDFEDWKAQRAGGDDEVVTVNARNAVTPAPLPASALPARESFDVRTMEGRARRDGRAALERTPGAYLDVSVPVSDVAHADGSQLVRDAYRSAVEARGVPGEFFDEWAKANNPTGYHITDKPGGVELTAADAYDEGSKAARIRLDANHVSQIVDAYKRSRGTFGRLKDWAASDEESSGEKVLDAAGAVGGPVAKAAGYIARPFQATSAGVFAAARGHNPLPVAYNTLTTGETPDEGTNPVGNYLRDSAVLNRINPRLGRVLGGGADVVLDPANLIGLGLLGRGAKALAGAGRIGRAAEEVGALGRSLGVLERGLVDARPLGLAAAGAGEGGEVAAMEDRLSRVLEVTRKLKAGEALTPEETALHAEVKAAAESAPSAAVRGEQLRYARERAEYYSKEAERLTGRAAKAHARAMADDYAQEAERLQAGSAAPSVEGYDVADAHHSRFQPRTTAGEFDGPPRPLWKRAVSNTAAVVQIPKVKAGWDLSATMRQGLAQAAAHPSYLKEAFARQVKAFASEDAFNEFAQAIRNHPDFELMNESGLFLSSVGPEAEEAFASKLVQKIPGVRASDRAYSAALDSVRTQAWDNYVSSLPEHLRDNPDTLKAVSDLINVTTGRGVVPILDRSALGKKIINALNVPLFSPRNTASKFNLISPARLAKNMMSAETRPVAFLQLRDAARGLGTLGTTLGLMHFAGLDVGLNPNNSDFGKVRAGKAVYDVTGEAYTVRYLAQMAQAATKEVRGRKVQDRETMTALTRRYLRTQLQPATGSAVDWWTGKTIDGKPVTSASAALNLITPFVVDDVIKGFREEGILGAAKATPGVLGVGVNFYAKPREKRGRQ
jgi:peptidoglycan L-alanyl-D-glutamate endopeptidase CwlK